MGNAHFSDTKFHTFLDSVHILLLQRPKKNHYEFTPNTDSDVSLNTKSKKT